MKSDNDVLKWLNSALLERPRKFAQNRLKAHNHCSVKTQGVQLKITHTLYREQHDISKQESRKPKPTQTEVKQ